MAGLIFFPIGVVAGMIIAWRKEAMGGFMTVASLVSFYLVYGYLLRNHIGGWFFLAFASPGFLFLSIGFWVALPGDLSADRKSEG